MEKKRSLTDEETFDGCGHSRESTEFAGLALTQETGAR